MDSTLNAYVASEIRAELGRQRRSQARLAVELGWSKVYLSRRLTGEVALSVGDVEAIAGKLGVPLAKLMPPVGLPA